MKKEFFKLLTKIYKKKFVLVGVPVIILNSKKEILLGKRNNEHPFYPSMWGIPGGLVEYEEKLKDAAKREIREELGVEIEIIKKLEIHENFPNKNCPVHTIDIPFLAKIIIGKPKAKDETSQVRWFKPSEIKKIDLAYEHKKILKSGGFI